MTRIFAALIAGLVSWFLLFIAFGILYSLVLPAYSEAARLMFNEDDYSHFSTDMLLLNMLMFVIIGLGSSVICKLISRNNFSGQALGGLLFIYTAINHYYQLWHSLPAWYNLLVPLVVSGSVVAGTHLYQPAVRQS